MSSTNDVLSLKGVRSGRRIAQAHSLPAFVTDPGCPVALVREFLGGMFGADGHAPVLKRHGPDERDAILGAPAFSRSAVEEHVESLRTVMHEVVRLLGRCGVATNGASVYEYPTRRSASSYPEAQDGAPRWEVRLVLPDGLSFVERVGVRYCVDKALRASAAAVYWRTVQGIGRQRARMARSLQALHEEEPSLSFSKARARAASALLEAEPAIHLALLAARGPRSLRPAPRGRRPQVPPAAS